MLCIERLPFKDIVSQVLRLQEKWFRAHVCCGLKEKKWKILHDVAHDGGQRAHSRLLKGSDIKPAKISTYWLWRYPMARAHLVAVLHPAEWRCIKEQAQIPKPVL